MLTTVFTKHESIPLVIGNSTAGGQTRRQAGNSPGGGLTRLGGGLTRLGGGLTRLEVV